MISKIYINSIMRHESRPSLIFFETFLVMDISPFVSAIPEKQIQRACTKFYLLSLEDILCLYLRSPSTSDDYQSSNRLCSVPFPKQIKTWASSQINCRISSFQGRQNCALQLQYDRLNITWITAKSCTCREYVTASFR